MPFPKLPVILSVSTKRPFVAIKEKIASRRQQSTSDDDINFKYQPLDRSMPSIRLIQILPGLHDFDELRCTITHTTIPATYTCLSYQWGSDIYPSKTILVNDKKFTVRQNLYAFLCVARNKGGSEDPSVLGPYWIDALCIDQSNVLERNHQVAQMSKIYIGAERVYIWLGLHFSDASSIAPVLQHGFKRIYYNDQSTRKEAGRRLVNCVVKNEYWTRAWVIQEFMLGSQIIVWLHTRCITLEDLLNSLFAVSKIEPDYHQDVCEFLQTWDKARNGHGDMIFTLNRFRNAQCYDARDRIFSLLSLVCGEGHSVQVDYRTSAAELAVEVIRHCPSSFCFCTVVLVVQALRLQDTAPPHINSESHPRLELPCRRKRIERACFNTCLYENNLCVSLDEDTGSIEEITYTDPKRSIRKPILRNEDIQIVYSGQQGVLRMSFHLLAKLMAGVHVELCLFNRVIRQGLRESDSGYLRIC